MDNRHKGIPDNPDIMWITSGTMSDGNNTPHPVTNPYTLLRVTGIIGILGGYLGYGDYRVLGTGVTRVPGRPGSTGARPTGYSHPVSGQTYISHGSGYVQPDVPIPYLDERTLITG